MIMNSPPQVQPYCTANLVNRFKVPGSSNDRVRNVKIVRQPPAREKNPEKGKPAITPLKFTEKSLYLFIYK